MLDPQGVFQLAVLAEAHGAGVPAPVALVALFQLVLPEDELFLDGHVPVVVIDLLRLPVRKGRADVHGGGVRLCAVAIPCGVLVTGDSHDGEALVGDLIPLHKLEYGPLVASAADNCQGRAGVFGLEQPDDRRHGVLGVQADVVKLVG